MLCGLNPLWDYNRWKTILPGFHGPVSPLRNNHAGWRVTFPLFAGMLAGFMGIVFLHRAPILHRSGLPFAIGFLATSLLLLFAMLSVRVG